MAFNFTEGQNHLFTSDFEIIEETIDNRQIYRLKDWYQLLNNSAVPISYLYSYDDFDIESEHAIVIGGNNTTNVFQENNKAFFVSKKYYKYDPRNVYRIKIRGKHLNSSTKIHVGFVGFTSRPNILRTYDTNEYYNECKNLHNFVFSHDGLFPTTNVGNLADFQHYVPINKAVEDDGSYFEYIGYISGNTSTPIAYNSLLGLGIDNSVPLRDEIEYFAPFFYINDSSFTTDDNIKTVIDFIQVDDHVIFDYTQNTVIIKTEDILNLSYYVISSDGLYALEGYVLTGYVDGTAIPTENLYVIDNYVIPGYVDGIFDPYYLNEDYMFEDYV